jgi:hypothetical protein
VLSEVAKETVGYTRADYLYTSGTSDAFLRYMEEIKKAGGSMRTHPFAAKIGIWHANQENVNNAIVRQLNAGHVSVSMEQVESAQEVRDVIKAMRLVSAGGTRPDTGLENAAAYWGLSVEQYKQKADIWPINKNGELLISVIIESREGVAKAREIAAEPGVGQIFAGYGTLGGVFRGDPEGREAASAHVGRRRLVWGRRHPADRASLSRHPSRRPPDHRGVHPLPAHPARCGQPRGGWLSAAGPGRGRTAQRDFSRPAGHRRLAARAAQCPGGQAARGPAGRLAAHRPAGDAAIARPRAAGE